MTSPRFRPAYALLAACALGAAGCSGYSRNVLSASGDNKVVLRSEKTLGVVQERGYDHPATIAGTRLAHILSRIDIRTDDSDANSRKPAIPADIVYELGEKLSNALAKATKDEEVVVISARRERNLGVFTHDFITSFSAYVQGDMLHIRLFHLDWEQPQGGPQAKIEEPVPDKQVMRFRVLPGQAMQPEGAQGVAVSWRDPIFKSPTAVRVTPAGKIVRRTVLMESEAPAEEGMEEEPLPSVTTGTLSPTQLRALADLEEQRRDGKVSENDYQARRVRILRGDPGGPAAD
ncbi:MAG: hypothetical protein IT386_06705 [Deltaproteobacteria bacterium]|nr:hypothetical protein [Deltaproteobacteria bacterium]